MKKILLAAVCAFALSQNSFAVTSFSDLIKLEKASFMPQIEIEVVESEEETDHTKTTELIREDIQTTDSFISETDVSSDWSFVNSEIIDTDETYKETLTREDLIPNTALAKFFGIDFKDCKTISKKWYDTRRSIVEKSKEFHTRYWCENTIINGISLKSCKSQTKTKFWTSVEDFFGVKVELECHEYYGTAKSVKAD